MTCPMKRIIYVGLFPLLAIFFACTSQPNANPERGKELAQAYCAACHAVPDPSLLDKLTWDNHVLPRMGYMYGIYPLDTLTRDSIREMLLGSGQEPRLLESVFPKKPRIARKDWNDIYQYYVSSAPDSLVRSPLPKLPDQKQFNVRISATRMSPPSTSMVNIRDAGLWVSDINTRAMYLFDGKTLGLKQAAKTPPALVTIHPDPNNIYGIAMGSLSPTDNYVGSLLVLPKDATKRPYLAIEGLQRPVHGSFADLNADGLEDVVISEFARWTGGLSWWELTPLGTYEKHPLRMQPGAIKTDVRDWNGDGLQDVMALFGQGDEGFFLYLNQGNKQFQEKRIIQFPAAYGSSFFEVLDVNQDGRMDLVYTCGDNADYPAVMKPYHGIRAFINKGDLNFEEAWFYPLNGAYGAMTRDFDLDGDLDVAAISFFPDYERRPEESFVYLENTGNFQFIASTFPESLDGRWLVMDAGDVDGDGDIDVVLGSLTFEVVPAEKNTYLQRWVEQGIPFILLENKSR